MPYDEQGEWCTRCGRHHQQRENKVPCARCRVLTLDAHAICVACQAKQVA